MDVRPKKDNWHTRRLKTKQKFSKSKSKDNSETSSNRGIPTPVIDVADSSDDRYSNRSISSTWYQNEFDVDIDEQMEAANFEDLQKPLTGNHFVFNSEKQWEESTIEKSEANAYFIINSKLVKAGLQTIPFCRRMDFNFSMFSNDQLKRMNDEAEKKEKEYQDVLKNYEKGKQRCNSKPIGLKISVTQPKTLENLENDLTQFKNNSQNDKDNELEELLNMTTENIGEINLLAEQVDQNLEKDSEVLNSFDLDKKAKETGDSALGKEDIQDWLDGILNE